MFTNGYTSIADIIISAAASNIVEYELSLSLDLIGEMIRETRKKRGLTQEQLGKIIGVQKAQISKLENSVTDVRIETILKVFSAMDARINFTVELGKEHKKVA